MTLDYWCGYSTFNIGLQLVPDNYNEVSSQFGILPPPAQPSFSKILANRCNYHDHLDRFIWDTAKALKA